MTLDTARYLTMEQQFCTLCKGLGKGWVRVIDVSDMVLLRREYGSEGKARSVYRQRRLRRLRAHYRIAHPTKELA